MAGKGWKRSVEMAWMALFVWSLKEAEGVRFLMDREECISHNVEYEGDTLHLSFVVIKSSSSWQSGNEGVDLIIKDPFGAVIREFRDRIFEKREFVVQHKGVYRFCFYNKSPYLETIDFDLHLAHFASHEPHAEDEHFDPLMEQISELEEALTNIIFEQHWIEAQTDRQAILNRSMSERAIHKAMLESVALIGSSILQVYLLKRMFEKKLGIFRV